MRFERRHLAGTGTWLFLGLISVASAWPRANLTFDPNPVDLYPASAGDTLTVELRIDSSELVMGVNLIFAHDPTRVHVTGLAAGPFLGRNGGSVANRSIYDNEAGRCSVSLGVLGGDPWGVAGAGTLLYMTLTAAADDPAGFISCSSHSVRDTSNSSLDSQIEDLQLRRAEQLPPATSILALPQNRYALVCLPLAFEDNARLSDVLEELGPAGARSWKGYGVSGGQLTSDPVLSEGVAFWLSTTLGRDSITAQGVAPPDTVCLSLPQGWNAIGVPWTSDPAPWTAARVITGNDTLAWTDSLAAQQLHPHLWWWADETADHRNDGTYETRPIALARLADSELGGFLVYAEAACSLLLARPGPTPLAGVATAAGAPNAGATGGKQGFQDFEEQAPAWAVEVSFAAYGSAEQTVRAGAWDGSRAGLDARDVLSPPAFLGGARLSILQDGSDWGEYMESYAAPGESEYGWDLLLDADSCVGTLTWGGLCSLPPGLHAYLVDPGTQRAVDLRAQDSFECAVPEGGRRLLLIVDRNLRASEPTAVRSTGLRIVCPTPMSETITIEYQLERAGLVDLRILDVTGRRVAQLDGGIKDAGFHTTHWRSHRQMDGCGVYFVCLRSRDQMDVQRVLFIR